MLQVVFTLPLPPPASPSKWGRDKEGNNFSPPVKGGETWMPCCFCRVLHLEVHLCPEAVYGNSVSISITTCVSNHLQVRCKRKVLTETKLVINLAMAFIISQ